MNYEDKRRQYAKLGVEIWPDGRLDVKNASKVTGKKPSTLAVYRCRGIGPAFMKLGNTVFFNIDDLEEEIRSSRRLSTANKLLRIKAEG